MNIFARTAAAATAAIGIAAMATPASAQMASYCDGKLTANSFYANVLSNGRTATVEYHGQFQNRDGRPMTATMVQLQRVGNFTIIRQIQQFDLNGWEQKDVTIMSIHVPSPGGQGAPSALDVGRTLRFSCSYR